ncbi:MAG: XTP/dITP diphosphatase [Phycisphaerae bacterium]
MVEAPTMLLATSNPGKVREVQAILRGLPVGLTTLADHVDLPPPIEDAATFEGNARLKALYYARSTRCLTLADDSGLEVDALNGQPGVRSSRYAGPQCDPAANNAKLIRELAGVPPERRTARFCCVMAVATPKEVVATASGSVSGVIIDEARGTNGFGYDPLFFVPEVGLTTAEMAPEQKNRISHRGRALAAIWPDIVRLLNCRTGRCGQSARRP